jgi:hypothetical protein
MQQLEQLHGYLTSCGSYGCPSAFAAAMQAVMDDWYFQMYYDDLPVWGFIGKVCSSGSRQTAQQAQPAAAAQCCVRLCVQEIAAALSHTVSS